MSRHITIEPTAEIPKFIPVTLKLHTEESVKILLALIGETNLKTFSKILKEKDDSEITIKTSRDFYVLYDILIEKYPYLDFNTSGDD